MEDENDKIQRHVAGATVGHAGPFSGLEVPSSTEQPDDAFIDRYIRPFYLDNLQSSSSFAVDYGRIRTEVTDSLICKLLSRFNWRPRLVGARFAAIEEAADQIDWIGCLLLRSDLCYSGGGYALALAAFNTPTSAGYLVEYLQYYLGRADLQFDQPTVAAAVEYLDRENGTDLLGPLRPQLESFSRSALSAPERGEWFAAEMAAVHRIRGEVSRRE